MKFIIDAQLPDALARHLTALGHDAIHVKQMPKAGDTPDAEIIALADHQRRVVVTKDDDFRYSYGPSPRILDTVVVDYAAVGSVAARWAS